MCKKRSFLSSIICTCTISTIDTIPSQSYVTYVDSSISIVVTLLYRRSLLVCLQKAI